jgi:nucleoside-diphosphate-sugar epimerase
MNKPRIFVTSAGGRTGSMVATQLLKKGFPVRANYCQPLAAKIAV